MPQIKLIITDSHTCGDYGDTLYRLGSEITDWEEVSTEDLAFLKKHKHELWFAMRASHPEWDYNHQLVILEMDRVSVRERLDDLKEKLKDKLKKEADQAEKRKVLAETRKQQKALQKAAQERKTFQELKAKFEAT